MVFEHILNTKIFKGNQAEPVNQISTNLMGKIVSLVSYPFMDPLNHPKSFLFSLECLSVLLRASFGLWRVPFPLLGRIED